VIAVIFEVEPADRGAYFRIAKELAPLLREIDGFISIERFQSLCDEGRILSLSFWRDEAAVAAWRNLEAHRAAQFEGRAHVFRNYRLRVAHVVRDYGMAERAEAPDDSQRIHQTNAPIPADRRESGDRSAVRLPLGPGSRFARPG
jgi:heme-degrading monooxygenase HmoA